MTTDVSFDAAAARRHFPALDRSPGGRRCVFADSPGGTQVPASVIDAMAVYLRDCNANAGGAFATSSATDEVIEGAHRAAADFLGCAREEVAIGANMTTLAFSLSRSIARTLGRGDEIVVTVLDHDANIAPWLAAAADKGATVRRVDIDTNDCTLDFASLDATIGPRTRMVAVTLASNAVGSVTPISEVVDRAHRAGALVVADAVHFAPHRLIDVAHLGVDFLFCSPYKFFGPHMGLMYGRRDLMDSLRPYKVAPSSDLSPHRWETGTGNHEAMAGLIAAIDYIASRAGEATSDRRARIVAGMDAITAYEAVISSAFLEGIRHVPRARLFGIADPGRTAERTPTFAVRFDDVHPRALAAELGRRGIFTWDGNYYAKELMERLTLEDSGGAVRIGFCHYNLSDEIDLVLETLAELAK